MPQFTLQFTVMRRTHAASQEEAEKKERLAMNALCYGKAKLVRVIRHRAPATKTKDHRKC